MKKNLILIILGIVLVTSAVGCSTSIGGNSGGDNPGGETPVNGVSRTPSLIEIKEVFKNTNLTYMSNALRTKISKLSSVSITDGINFITKIKQIYGKDPVVAGENIFTNVAEMGLLSTYCTTVDAYGPILIIKNASIVENGKTEKVNVVLLGGTQIKEGQATGIIEDLYSGMELTNEYLYDAYYAIYDNLRNDTETPLVIGGISLGGMVAQQLAALPALKEYYNVRNVVSVASPIISPELIDYSKTQVNRMVDTVDLVPQVSVSYNGSYDSAYGNSNKAVVKTSGYKTFIGAHTLGYVDLQNNIWSDVDVLGNLNGNAKLKFDKSNMAWYDALKYTQSK